MGSRNVLSATRTRQSITQSNAIRDNHSGLPGDHGVSASPHCARFTIIHPQFAIRCQDDEKSHRHVMMPHAGVRCPTAMEFAHHSTTQSHDGIISPSLVLPRPLPVAPLFKLPTSQLPVAGNVLVSSALPNVVTPIGRSVSESPSVVSVLRSTVHASKLK